VIGLTGGIGSGKSTVAAILAEQGVGVIDSDKLSREELQHPEVIAELVGRHGPEILDSNRQVQRAALAKVVFADPNERKHLEGLLHPRIERRRQALVRRYNADPAVVAIALDSPLLYEVGLDAECDAVLFVDADRQERVARVAARGWNACELERREKLQNRLDLKKAKADHIIVNNSGRGLLRQKVRKLLSDLLTQASR
jgi:dephospho-CoA kinase